MNTLLGGLVFGMLFGFLLQRGRVVWYDMQVGTLRFKDMTIVKFMFSSILVAMVGVEILYSAGLASRQILPVNLWAIIVGGLVFGLGWSLIGY
ncbi:MAG: YeeE/YedE thiosulfate transporter family protein [Nitrospirota bacterium]